MSAMNTNIRFFLVTGLLVLSAICSSICAQGVADRAADLGRLGRWIEAKQLLAPAMESAAHESNGRSWFVMGFIHKELHKEQGEFGAESPERLAAVFCFQRAIQLGLNASDQRMAVEALDFLARSYFREAIAMVEGFTWGSTAEILSLYGRYEALEASLNPNKDFGMQRSDLNRYLGQAHAVLLESQPTRSADELQAIFEAAIEHYRIALEGKSNDYATQYNLAITLYNQGVRKLKSIGYETSMFELMEIQDMCIALFEQSLIPMQAAHAQEPDRLETLKGLMTLHYALSQKEESDRYRAQIEEILGNR